MARKNFSDYQVHTRKIYKSYIQKQHHNQGISFEIFLIEKQEFFNIISRNLGN